MVGMYEASTGSLVLRKPAALFVPLAWLLAGVVNPLSFLAFEAYGVPFDLSYWIVCTAIPLSIGCAAAIFYLRGGGFGFVTLTLITVLAAYVSCAGVGPIYTIGLWALMQFDIFLSELPLWSLEAAIRTSGTFIRLSIFLVAVPILPAAIILRLVAFRREARKQKPPSTASVL